MARCIDGLDTSVENALKLEASNFGYYSLLFGESTDVSDTAQLATLICGDDKAFHFTEEMAALVTIKGTTKSSGVFEGIIATLKQLSLNLTNLTGLTVDDGPAVVER
jgi:hypothetical protein